MAAVQRNPSVSRRSNTNLRCDTNASTNSVQEDICISIFTAPEEDSTLLASRDRVTGEGERLSVSMRPLLLTMRLTGIYFKRHGIALTGLKSTSSSPTKYDRFIPDKRIWPLVYALFATVLLCGNAIRYVTAFDSTQFSSTFINKLATLIIFSMCAVNRVSCFIASFNGNVNRVLRSVCLDRDAAEKNRRRTLSLVRCYWAATTGLYFFLIIGFFVKINPLSPDSDKTLDFYLAPFINQISAFDILLLIF